MWKPRIYVAKSGYVRASLQPPCANHHVCSKTRTTHMHTTDSDRHTHVHPAYSLARITFLIVQQHCEFFYEPRWNGRYSDGKTLWTVDTLMGNASEFERLSDLELALEDKTIAALSHPKMADIYMDFFERWRAIGGSLLVAPSLIRQPVRCLTGGHGCGHRGVMLHPHDTSAPFLQALRSYWSGRRSSLPFGASGASDAAAQLQNKAKLCHPTCVWGVCTSNPEIPAKGLCRCFDGYTGPACNVTGEHKNRDCHDPIAPVGMNVAGLSDWSRQWDFVDVFKKSRKWLSQDFNSYSWNDGRPLPLTEHGFPTALAANQLATTLLMRDLNQHHPSGNFTGNDIHCMMTVYRLHLNIETTVLANSERKLS